MVKEDNFLFFIFINFTPAGRALFFVARKALQTLEFGGQQGASARFPQLWLLWRSAEDIRTPPGASRELQVSDLGDQTLSISR